MVEKAKNIMKNGTIKKQKQNKFKQHDPRYLHIDVTYLSKIDDVKYYLFIAIDRATKILHYKVYGTKKS
jgi:transposase-like protein